MRVAEPPGGVRRVVVVAVLAAAFIGAGASVGFGVGARHVGPRSGLALPLVSAVGGTLVSLLAATVAVLVVTGRSRSSGQVSRATTDLETANRDLGAARDSAAAESRAKSEFLSTMSHEIRTPMNAVIGLTEIVLDGQLEPEQRGHLETIRRSGDTLLP